MTAHHRTRLLNRIGVWSLSTVLLIWTLLILTLWLWMPRFSMQIPWKQFWTLLLLTLQLWTSHLFLLRFSKRRLWWLHF